MRRIARRGKAPADRRRAFLSTNPSLTRGVMEWSGMVKPGHLRALSCRALQQPCSADGARWFPDR
jgi:hypothetical protein